MPAAVEFAQAAGSQAAATHEGFEKVAERSQAEAINAGCEKVEEKSAQELNYEGYGGEGYEQNDLFGDSAPDAAALGSPGWVSRSSDVCFADVM